MDSIQKILSQTDRAFSEDKMPIGQDEIKELVKSTLRPALSGHPAEDASLEGSGEEGAEFTPRFKDHQEAEGKLTEQEQAVGKLATDLSETKDLLLRVLANQSESGQPSAQTSETPAPEQDFLVQRRRQVIDEIEALDDLTEDYADQVARIQAKADNDIHNHSMTEFMEEVSAEQQRIDTESTVQVQINAAMESAGLDLSNEGDSALFSHCSNRFQIVGERLIDTTTRLPISTDDAISKTVTMVRDYKFGSTGDHQRRRSSPEISNEPASVKSILEDLKSRRRA